MQPRSASTATQTAATPAHTPRRALPAWTAAALASLCVLLLWWPLTWVFDAPLRGLEERSGDWVWQQVADPATERRIVIVDIDEASLRALGPWPWPRAQLAQLSNALAAQGAALQVFDVVLAAPAAGDAELAATLARNQALLAQVFALAPGTGVASGHTSGALPGLACPGTIPQALGHLANPLAYAGLPVGHITPQLAPDGLLRHQPALICHQGRAYPALFLAALMHASGSASLSWQPAPRPSLQPQPAVRLHGLELGPRAGLPLGADGLVRLPWSAHPDAFISLPAHDVLAGRVPQGLLDNAWVLVGSTALSLGDRVATPFGPHGAGVMVHAQLLRAALDARLPYQPAASALYAAAIGLLAWLSLLWLAGRSTQASTRAQAQAHAQAQRSPRNGKHSAPPAYALPLLGLAWAVAAWGAHALALAHLGWWLPWAALSLLLLLLALALAGLIYARQRLERARLLRHLGSYLPAPVAAALLERDPSDRIEARRLELTVLYADIRNFSAYCERRPADESTAVLQAFLSAVTHEVEQRGGRVEAFEQDAVLAVFEPGPVDRSSTSPSTSPSTAANGPAAPATPAACAQAALAAAQAIIARSASILPQWPDDAEATPDHPPLAPLAIGIGIDTGPAILGSFGLAQRRTHRALGPAVSAASRLQGMTAELAHPILVGAPAQALIGSAAALERMGDFLLDGLRSPVTIYAQPLAPPASTTTRTAPGTPASAQSSGSPGSPAHPCPPA